METALQAAQLVLAQLVCAVPFYDQQRLIWITQIELGYVFCVLRLRCVM